MPLPPPEEPQRRALQRGLCGPASLHPRRRCQEHASAGVRVGTGSLREGDGVLGRDQARRGDEAGHPLWRPLRGHPLPHVGGVRGVDTGTGAGALQKTIQKTKEKKNNFFWIKLKQDHPMGSYTLPANPKCLASL